MLVVFLEKDKTLQLIFVVAVDGMCCHPGSLFGEKQKNLRKDIELSSVKPEISCLFSVFGQVIELSFSKKKKNS